MNFEQLWLIIVRKNKMLSEGDTVTMTRDNFHKAMKLAFDEGVKYCKDSRDNYDLLGDFFKGFGKDR